MLHTYRIESLTAASGGVKGGDCEHYDLDKDPHRCIKEGKISRVDHLVCIVNVPDLARDGHTLRD